jgi:hypothetical protein
LVVVIIDCEIAGQAGVGGFTTKQARAEGMESGDPDIRRPQAAGTQEIADALLHYIGGFICEGDGKDCAGGDAGFDEMSNAIGDDTRLASSSAGEHQHGAVRREDCFALAFVQSVEE